MANVLTNLYGDIYKAVDLVPRELTGIIPSCTINGNDSDRVAVGQNVTSAFTNEPSEVDVTPSMTIPEGTDQTVGNKSATITKSKAIQIPWVGEDVRKLQSSGLYDTVQGDQIAQAMRKLTNLMEIDLATEAYQNASRAVGTAGTTPFGSTHHVINSLEQILADNGAPVEDGLSSVILSSTAATNFKNLSNLYKVNEAGTDSLLRQGAMQDIGGLMIKRSAGIRTHTKGTGASFQTSAAFSAGDETISLDTGTGTILAGDVVTFAADSTNKYVVNTALTGGDIVLGEPGLLVDVADNNALTVGNSYVANIAFHRSALELIVRPPALPDGEDAAVDSMMVQDPRSGLVFEIRVYMGYKKKMIEVAAAWGVKAWMPKYIATLMG